MPELSGSGDGRGLRVAIAVSRFHEAITGGLLRGARRVLAEAGVSAGDVTVASVPGALELPWAAARFAATGRHDAVVVLGAVVRGETDHYDFVCAETIRGAGRVATSTGLPVTVGVLTCATLAQAIERSGDDERNKGAEAARAAVETATLARALGGKDTP